MLDAALKFGQRAKDASTLVSQWFPDGQPFVLATIHRAENTDNPAVLAAILQALHHIHADKRHHRFGRNRGNHGFQSHQQPGPRISGGSDEMAGVDSDGFSQAHSL